MTTIKPLKQLISVLITDDHMMVRDGLKVMLADLHPGLHFKITEAGSGAEALHKINLHHFELVIIDYQMPGLSGAETVCRILRYKPDMKILALSNYDELAYIQAMMDAGARGFVLKSIEPAELYNAIKTILSGKIYYCSDVAVKLIDASQAKEPGSALAKAILTQREMEVLQMIAMEMTNEEIAGKLFVAKRTVDTHRQNLINKLQVKNTAGLVKVAMKMNLVEVK
jgi:DNA-binding NarL/FixJ family response regulator